VLKGWVEFEYEGIGKVTMKAGSCFYQPPRIRHREIRHSKNLEMIEVVSPAVFKTRAAAPPAARKSPARRSRG
jgi:mannose-6-phosphate isomerase-like protein (cupin superfamily)